MDEGRLLSWLDWLPIIAVGYCLVLFCRALFPVMITVAFLTSLSHIKPKQRLTVDLDSLLNWAEHLVVIFTSLLVLDALCWSSLGLKPPWPLKSI